MDDAMMSVGRGVPGVEARWVPGRGIPGTNHGPIPGYLRNTEIY